MTRKKIWGEKAQAIEDRLYELDQDLADLIINTAYETVFAREGLDLKTRELLAIVMLMSVGTSEEIRTHIHGALNCGAAISEVKESILQAAMYLGFPKALAAMNVLKEVEAKRG